MNGITKKLVAAGFVACSCGMAAVLAQSGPDTPDAHRAAARAAAGQEWVGLLGTVCPETSAAPRDRKSTRLNSSHIQKSRMPSSA